MRRLPILAVLLAAAAIATVHARKTPELAWPQFRGPGGAGILDQAKLPETWSNTGNVAWSVEVKGRGWSSPVAWRLGGLIGQSTPTPLAAGGLLYLATGSQGESNRPVFAVRPGASGDISLAKGQEQNACVAWSHPRASASAATRSRRRPGRQTDGSIC